MAGPTTRPLAGRTIVVTRTTAQASQLADALVAEGANVVSVPVIGIADPADGGVALRAAVAELDRYAWVVATSANGAERLLAAVGDPRRLRGGPPVAAIGPGTAAVFEASHVEVRLVPERFVAEGLLEVFPPPPPEGGTVLLAQAAGARPVLRDGLAAQGWAVVAPPAYTTIHPPPDEELLAQATQADTITFTSASTVEGFVAAAGLDAVPPLVASIGPITTERARALGVVVDLEATEHTIPGLVATLIGHRRIEP